MRIKKLVKLLSPKIIFETFVIVYKSRHNKTMGSFKKDFMLFASKITDDRFNYDWNDRVPCLKDAVPSTPFEPHYTYHTAWAARILANTKPEKHIDISSSIQFVVVASAFVPVDFYDYRPAPLHLSNLNCKSADITSLPFSDHSVASLSCMHVVEHIGLGRYGDPLDPVGDVKAIKELSRVLAKEGQLLFVVPLAGIAKIQFNAHRIYTFDLVVKLFGELILESFSLINDEAMFIENATKEMADQQSWGCGCFLFKKK